jgi:hypothetical protein
LDTDYFNSHVKGTRWILFRALELILEAIKARGLTASDIGVICNELKLLPVEVSEKKLSMDFPEHPCMFPTEA